MRVMVHFWFTFRLNSVDKHPLLTSPPIYASSLRPCKNAYHGFVLAVMNQYFAAQTRLKPVLLPHVRRRCAPLSFLPTQEAAPLAH